MNTYLPIERAVLFLKDAFDKTPLSVISEAPPMFCFYTFREPSDEESILTCTMFEAVTESSADRFGLFLKSKIDESELNNESFEGLLFFCVAQVDADSGDQMFVARLDFENQEWASCFVDIDFSTNLKVVDTFEVFIELMDCLKNMDMT